MHQIEIEGTLMRVHTAIAMTDQFLQELRWRADQVQILLEALHSELRELYDLTHVREAATGVPTAAFHDVERSH